jgi:AraC-like DNA-binding protein
LINYIQQRRLQRAFSLLMSTARPTPRILDIALDNHFASDATFNRAFRRAYGVPPGELRSLASTQHSRAQ